MNIQIDKDLRSSGKLIEFMRPLMMAVNKAGYTLSIRYDLEDWANARKQLDPKHTVVMPTFDPAACNQEGSYWIEAKTKDGELVAVIAARLFVTPDFIELMRTGHVWSDNPLHERLNLCLPNSFEMSGRILYRGGLCVKREHRKSGLSWALPRLVSLISIDNGVDYTVSHNLADLHGNGFTFRVYGHAGSELCFDGSEFFPPTSDRRAAYFVWTDFNTAVKNARVDSEILIRSPNEDLSNLAVLAQGPNKVNITAGVA